MDEPVAQIERRAAKHPRLLGLPPQLRRTDIVDGRHARPAGIGGGRPPPEFDQSRILPARQSASATAIAGLACARPRTARMALASSRRWAINPICGIKSSPRPREPMLTHAQLWTA